MCILNDSLSIDEDVHLAVVHVIVTFVSVLLRRQRDNSVCVRLDHVGIEVLVFCPHIDY